MHCCNQCYPKNMHSSAHCYLPHPQCIFSLARKYGHICYRSFACFFLGFSCSASYKRTMSRAHTGSVLFWQVLQVCTACISTLSFFFHKSFLFFLKRSNISSHCFLLPFLLPSRSSHGYQCFCDKSNQGPLFLLNYLAGQLSYQHHSSKCYH